MKPKAPLERDTQKLILQYLQASNIFAWINKTQGTWDPTRKVFRRNTTTVGNSDILGILSNGRMIAIEVKRRPNKQTDEQRIFLQMINDRGGIGFVAYSLEDVKENLKGYL